VLEARNPAGVRNGPAGVSLGLRYLGGRYCRSPLAHACCLLIAICCSISLQVTLSDAGVAKTSLVGKLDAAYRATLLGFPIGEITWTVDVRDKSFSAAATGATAGLLLIFARGHGTAEAHGSFAGKQLAPSNFAVNYSHGSSSEEIKIVFSGGKAREYLAPPPRRNPNIIPLTDAFRNGVVDPMTALIVPVPDSGDASTAADCDRKIPVFDGRMRYDMGLAFKRIEHVKADTGYQGPVVVCRISFTPLAGYDPTRYAIKYLEAESGMELWLAPLTGTRLMVPFRVSVPTPIGVGVLQATRFVWTRQNSGSAPTRSN
jgi:hypothetical protein